MHFAVKSQPRRRVNCVLAWLRVSNPLKALALGPFADDAIANYSERSVPSTLAIVIFSFWHVFVSAD
ncbi:MAG: hypothetical protein HCTETUND1_114 [Candidatus Hodgkinia cicadicola]|nr:MAG: hypothetical protein HCTETUND1_114 [Candidatus Hodgkinia cicadicola]